MKTHLLAACALTLGMVGTTNAQSSINLDLQHHFDGNAFAYGNQYMTSDGKAITFSRVQYYLCGFDLIHDGGQTTNIPDTYVLASGNVSSYPLGQANITNLEGIEFDFGVDATANGMGTSNWPSGHPLASQSPTMDWSWPSGYFFFTIDGEVDSNGDGTPDTGFQLHGLGDPLFRNVTALNGLNETGATIDVTVYVNVADWVKNLTLENVGFDHSGSANNIQVADNTNDETVFTLNSTLSMEELEAQHNIFADYTFPYAPTIYYDLATAGLVDVKVIDMNGRVQLEQKGLEHEGNYFIRKELPSGNYIIVFSNDEMQESFHFIVKQ